MKKMFFLFITLACFDAAFSQTSSSDIETLVAAADKAFNEHNIQEYVSYFADDAEMYSTVDYKEPVKGKEAIEQLVTGWFTLIPDMATKENHTYVNGNTVIEEFEFGGTIKALLPGYPPDLKDKTFNVKACTVTTIENGKVKTMNMYWDYLSLLNQLGWTNIVPGH
jgi:steroid delta-isomerase-like uncharacterized protein